MSSLRMPRRIMGDERRCTLQDRQLVITDPRIRVVISEQPFVPRSASVATFVRETEDQEEELRAAGLGQSDFCVGESFGFDGRNRLPGRSCLARRGQEECRENEASHESSL